MTQRKAGVLVSAFAAGALIGLSLPANADVVTDWNVKGDSIAIDKQILPVVHARANALVHVAMFEAVNAIERRYASYKINLVGERGLSKEAAAAAAAHDVLLSLHPDRRDDLERTLTSTLAAVPESDDKTKAIELGRKAAAATLALRAEDSSNVAESYRPHSSPGVYVPTTVPAFSTAARTRPWVLTASEQFRPAPPPALDSEVWSRDLNEIRAIGGRNSTQRSAEQTAIGRFWLMVGPRTYNPLVRQIAASKEMTLIDCARLFALTAMAGHDALIAVFDAKYAFNLWRPITAIRNADLTNNAATPRDASWLPLGDTPMHPEYPCAHCISSSAVGAVLQAVVGNDVPEMTMTSATAPGVTRKWTKISDYSDEVALARIYAGFHYRFSAEVGKEMGRRIGELVAATQLRGAEASATPRR
jgi:hypothetical protein